MSMRRKYLFLLIALPLLAVMLFRTGTASGAVSDWSVVPSVDPNPLNNSFNGVSAAYPSSFAWRTLVEHWNGRSWKIDLSPNVGYNGSILFGVTRIPNTEKLWAVGAYNLPSAYLRTLTEYSD